MFNKDLDEIKNRQPAMNNIITEVKNTLRGTSSRIIEAEKWIIELEDRMVEITEAEQNKKKELKNEDSPRDLLDDIKCINIQIIGVLEEDKMAWENIWGDYSQKLP